MKQVWQSDDGKKIGSKEEINDYEWQLKNPLSAAVAKVESTYSVHNLLTKHKRTEQGTWEIRGEDHNCDFGGSHHQPYIATVSGTLKQAIEYASKSAEFFTWGGGGSINKINIVKL